GPRAPGASPPPAPTCTTRRAGCARGRTRSQLFRVLHGLLEPVAERFPEAHRPGVVVPHDEVHLRAPDLPQPPLELGDELPADPAAPLVAMHGHVVDPAPPAVPAAERGPDEMAVLLREQHEVRVACGEDGERRVVVTG